MQKVRILGLFIISIITFYTATGCTYENESVKKMLDEKEKQQVISTEYIKSKVSNSEKRKKITIGVSMQGLDSPYVVSVKKYFEEAIEASGPNIEAIIFDGQANSEKQVSQIENFISQKVDAIILNPISFDGCAPAVDAANKARIPIITLITLVRNQEKCASFVGSDHQESGIFEAIMAANHLKGTGNIVVIEGVMGIDAQLKRYEGYQSVLAKFPKIKVSAIQPASWQRSEAYALVENWIQSGKEFNVVLSENDNMAMGAILAVEEAGLQDKIKVFGIDGDRDALQAVKEGRLEGTVFQDAKAQAYKAVECVIRLTKGEQIINRYVIPFKEVNKDNVDEFLKN